MQIFVLSNGDYVNLTDGSISRLTSYDGIGLPPHHIITDRGPYQHGENCLDFRLDPREMTFVFNIVSASSGYDLEGKMRSFAYLFKPRSGANPLWMKFITDYEDTRYAQVSYVNGIQITRKVGEGKVYNVPVVVRMHDPLFRSASTVSGCSEYLLSSAMSGSAFTVPTYIPTSIRSEEIFTSCLLTYSGTWRTFPIVSIVGPAENCIVRNATTDEKLDFSGYLINYGDVYTVDCRYGNKTVTNAIGENKINELSGDSDLGTFHFGAAPDSASGINTIEFSARAINDSSKVIFTYDTMYVAL